MRLLFILLPLLLSPIVSACLWDTDTLRDELKKDTSVYELITGQFPHHGKSYYQARVNLLEKRKELTVLEQHDLGVAYTRLDDFEKAKSVFYAIKEEQPESYEVHSNIGVMYKKMGDFEKSYTYIKRALEIKPEGHMGLGDWYLKRIGYEMNPKDSEKPVNFLGDEYVPYIPYILDIEDMELRTSLLSDELLDKVRLLIHNDYKFSDAYVFLGDILLARQDLHMATRAYMRAKFLGHPHVDKIDQKIARIHEHWKDIDPGYQGFMYGQNEVQQWEGFQVELEKAKQWNVAFEKEEEKLVATGKFPSLEETMEQMKIEKFHPDVSGESFKKWWRKILWNPFSMVFIAAVFGVIFLYLYKRRKLRLAQS